MFLGKSDKVYLSMFRRFSKIPIRPMDPTQAESVGTKISKRDLEKLLNPIGFLEEKEKKDYEGLEDLTTHRKYDYVNPEQSKQAAEQKVQS